VFLCHPVCGVPAHSSLAHRRHVPQRIRIPNKLHNSYVNDMLRRLYVPKCSKYTARHAFDTSVRKLPFSKQSATEVRGGDDSPKTQNE
jgi:hypothetical protein